MITINEIFLIFLILFFSITLAFYCYPKVMLLSLKKNLLDSPNSRKIHKTTASRLGGICFMPIIFITSLIVIAYLNIYGLGYLNIVVPNSFLIEISSLIIIYFIGVYDDIIGIKYNKKFIFQFLIASLIITSGTYINEFNGLFGINELPRYAKAILTFVLLILITNSLNLIDGVDGLCSSISIFAFTIYGLIFFLIDDTLNGLICFSTVGVLIPFFYFNVFGIKKHIKSKIFMGDSGSLLLGFLLSIMSIKVWNIHMSSTISIYNKYYHIAAFVMILIPCLDVARVVLHRLKKKKPIFCPDKSHFHHKLLCLNLKTKQILIVTIVLTFIYFLLDMIMVQYYTLNVVFLTDIIIWTILNILITRKIEKNRL